MTISTRNPKRGAALAAVLALAGAAAAQQPAPTPPTPPAAPAIKQFGRTSSSWTVSQSTDGKTVTVRGKDGDLSAEIDGKPVPAERVRRTDSGVTITDEDGTVVFDQPVPDTDTMTVRVGPGGATRIFAPRAGGGRGMSFYGRGFGPGAAAAGVPVEEPRVMIGVQLADPDASLRGHFGIKADEATLVSAVYEGLPAQAAGLEPYDIIVGINGQAPAGPAAVRKVLRDIDPGASVKVDVLHKGERKTVTLTPERYDREKIEKAKVNAIAALERDAPLAAAIAGAPGVQTWSFQGGMPYVGVTPGANGQPHVRVFGNAMDDEMAAKIDREVQEAMKRLQEHAAQLNGPQGLNQRLEQRLREMEERLQRLQGGVPTPPLAPAPAQPAPAPTPAAGSQS
jgi:membrane-associated protease RseP (regulator of RpoE activity)